MNLDAQPWTADFRTTAAPDSVPFFWVFLISGFWRFLSLLGWVGMFLRVLSCRPPPLSAGAGLGNLAVLLWPRTRFLSFFLGGVGVFLRVLSYRPPRSVTGLVWVLWPPYCGPGRVF